MENKIERLLSMIKNIGKMIDNITLVLSLTESTKKTLLPIVTLFPIVTSPPRIEAPEYIVTLFPIVGCLLILLNLCPKARDNPPRVTPW